MLLFYPFPPSFSFLFTVTTTCVRCVCVLFIVYFCFILLWLQFRTARSSLLQNAFTFVCLFALLSTLSYLQVVLLICFRFYFSFFCSFLFFFCFFALLVFVFASALLSDPIFPMRATTLTDLSQWALLCVREVWSVVVVFTFCYDTKKNPENWTSNRLYFVSFFLKLLIMHKTTTRRSDNECLKCFKRWKWWIAFRPSAYLPVLGGNGGNCSILFKTQQGWKGGDILKYQ